MADTEEIRVLRATTWLTVHKKVSQLTAEEIVKKMDGMGGKITEEELIMMGQNAPHMIDSIIEHLHRTPITGTDKVSGEQIKNGGGRRRKSKKKSKKRKSKKRKSKRRKTRRRR